MTEPIELTDQHIVHIASLGGTVSLMEDAVQTLESSILDDREMAALALMPTAFRLRVSGRLIELAEMMREALRELDGRVMQITLGGPAQ